MKKIHRKVIQLQARKFDKLLKWVNNVEAPVYSKQFVEHYNKVLFPNGVNPNAVSRNSKWLKPSVKAKIVRAEISEYFILNSACCSFKDKIFFEVTGIDAEKRRKIRDFSE